MRRDAADNRNRLVAAAEEVFARHGTAATLDDVARAAGIGPATLYRHFADKDALVREVLAVFSGAWCWWPSTRSTPLPTGA